MTRSLSRLRSRSRDLNVDFLRGLPAGTSAKSLPIEFLRPRTPCRATVGDASGVSDPAVDMLTSAISASGAEDGSDGNARLGEKLAGGVHVVVGLANENGVTPLLLDAPNIHGDDEPLGFDSEGELNVLEAAWPSIELA